MKKYDWSSLSKVALLSLNTYLILSLNFVGIFAQGPPNQRLQHHQTTAENESENWTDVRPSNSEELMSSSVTPNEQIIWKFSSPKLKSFPAHGNLSKLTPRKKRASASDEQFKPSPLANSNVSPPQSKPLSHHYVDVKPQTSHTSQTIQTSPAPLVVAPTAHNNIDLSQVSVPAKSAVSATVASPVAAAPVQQLATAATTPFQAVGAVSPLSIMSQVVDPPKLTVRFPSFVTPDKLVENSIDRFDAYDTYDYTEEFPEQSRPQKHWQRQDQRRQDHQRWHRPQPTLARPQRQHQQALQPPQPQRLTSGNDRWFSQQTQLQYPYGGPPRREDVSSPFLKLSNSQNTVPYHQASVNSIPLNSLRPPPPPNTGLVSSFLGLVGLDRNTQAGPSQYPADFSYSSSNNNYNNNYNQEETGGLANTFLSFIGVKDKATTASLKGQDDYSIQDGNINYSNFNEDYYDNGDYAPYQNSISQQPAQQKPLSVGARVVKWFDGFKIPATSNKNQKAKKPAGSDRVQNSESLDYGAYDTGDDHNLVFYDKPAPGAAPAADNVYGFGDVIDSIRRNETTLEIVKKFLSAAAQLSARSDSNPKFMLWTVPTTLFALLGIVYFVGAGAILAYKSFIDNNNNAFQIVPVIIAFAIPGILALIFVTSRAAFSGKLNVNQLARGDIKNSMRSDFDGVEFTLDSVFGAAAILGVGWIASVAL